MVAPKHLVILEPGVARLEGALLADLPERLGSDDFVVSPEHAADAVARHLAPRLPHRSPK